jgi:phytoene dehydrogenase-like protein
VPDQKHDAIVIGAGPNGLTAAAVLARGGRKVLVLESAAEIGGHTRAIEFAPGFRSPLNEDMGWLPAAVARATRTSKLQKAGGALSMSVAAGDGRVLNFPARISAAVEQIGKLSKHDAARWPAFVDRLQKFAAILGDLYQLTPPDIDTSSVREVLPLVGVGRKLRGLGRADMTEFLRVMPMPVQDLLDDTFENELLKAGLAAAAVRDLMQGPRSGGTTFNLLHYMVGGGPGSVRGRSWHLAAPDAFAQAAAEALRKRKVEIRTDARVERIVVKEGAVAGVVLSNGDQIDATTVLSTVDPRRTMLGMVDPVWLDPEFMLAIRNIKLRGCTAFVFMAIDRELDDTPKSFTAAVSLTPTTVMLERAADAAKYGELSAEPHIELFSPTLRWPHLAPEGKHIVTARVQYAPYLLKGGSWDDATTTTLKEKVTAAIARVVPGFEASIIHRVALTPRDVEERFGVTEGALTQGEMTLDQILFMRPVPGWGRYAMPIDGLFLAGSGAHPGPGVLGGAGFLAARTALGRKTSSR